MNMGLILFLSSFLLGTPSDKETENYSEQQQKTDVEKTNPETIINQQINPITISGNPKTKIMQGEFYIFTPFVRDVERNKLQFLIKNKPNWAIFDTRTGSLSGNPQNLDVGISESITISVIDTKRRKVSLSPFAIEVININDRPFMSGTPDETIEIGKTYKFTPKVKDIDLDIAKDTLVFSIKNKPKWATFNKQTGALTGNPKAYIKKGGLTTTEIEEIIITVTDFFGASDSLKPFIIDIDNTTSEILSINNKTIEIGQASISTKLESFSNHYYSEADSPTNIKENSTNLSRPCCIIGPGGTGSGC